MNINELKKEAKTLQPSLQIGKRGLTDMVFIEIRKLFRRRHLVKVKILNNCPLENKNELVAFVAEKADATLISQTGNVFVLFRPLEKKKPKRSNPDKQPSRKFRNRSRTSR